VVRQAAPNPGLHTPVRSIRYEGWLSRIALTIFAVSFIALGYLGLQPAEAKYLVLARLFTVCYFAFFWLMPFNSKIEAVKAVPERVTRSQISRRGIEGVP